MQVLDLCAAPGSKSTQILHRLNTSACTKPASSSSLNTYASGYLVANEPQQRRSSVLVGALKASGYTNYAVTAYFGEHFPLSGGDEGTSAVADDSISGAPGVPIHGSVRFDKVLADVPCSGDGTLRKNVRSAEPGLVRLYINLCREICWSLGVLAML